MSVLFRCALCIGFLALLSSVQSNAGVVDNLGWSSGVASVAGQSWFTPSPGNGDAVGTSDNKLFILQKDYTAIGPVDIIVSVVDDPINPGTTEYEVTEGVFNNTPFAWNGYHIELGFGTGGGFVKSTPGDGLNFDYPDDNSPVNFAPFGPPPFPYPTYSRPSEDDLVASGGIMAPLDYSGNFIFHVDVPDGISSFTIRQSPLPVPEPSAIGLIGLGVLGFGLMRRQLRRA